MSDRQDPGAGQSPPRGLVKGVLLAGVLGALLVTSALISTSFASAASGWTMSAWWGRHQRHHAVDPGRAREHAEYAVGWLLHSVDGTEEQELRVNEIVGALIEDVFAHVEQDRANRQALIDEFSKVEIDRDALERIRRSELELADTLSARLVGALADVAEVLTPEQRLELIERTHSHRH